MQDNQLQQRAALQDVMVFIGSIAAGTEQMIGESASGISYLAGKDLGLKLSKNVAPTQDVELALEKTRALLRENGCLWTFELFKPHQQEATVVETEQGTEVQLVFRDCMIRQSLFRFGHPQKGSLCTLMYGFFAGALQNIMQRESSLEIVHAGENACLKKLLIRRGV